MSKALAARLLRHSPYLHHLLESCKTISELKQIHAQIHKTGFSHDSLIATKLLETLCTFMNSCNLDYAHQLFDQIPRPNTFTWNTMIQADSKSTHPNVHIAMLYKEMLHRSAKPNGITFFFISNACSDHVFLMTTHAHTVQLGLYSDAFVMNSLVRGYSASGKIDSARRVFEELPLKDLVAWTVLLNGYVRSNRSKEAIDLFFLMRQNQVVADEAAIVAIFTACAQLKDLDLARRLECLVRESGIEFNSFVTNALIDMYSKCGSIVDVEEQFDKMAYKDVVAWNSMISAFGRSGNMSKAKRLFEQMPIKNEISWSALLNGYVQNGAFKDALEVFDEMRTNGVISNDASTVGAITASAHLGALELGIQIHQSLGKLKVQSDVVIATALVDMYAKCGLLETSLELFDEMSEKNLVSFNVMILGLSVHGRATECLHLFAKLLRDDLRPDSVTFVGILSGCAHAGLLKEGKEYFNKMKAIYEIAPQVEHISCMVQLMGREGLLLEAHEFIKNSTVKPDVITWGALLSACKFHGDVELGELVAREILEMDHFHKGAYVLLSNIYAAANKWDEVVKIRKKMNDIGIQNRRGRSWIEVDGKIHEFCAGDNLHPEIEDFSSVLHSMKSYMYEISI